MLEPWAPISQRLRRISQRLRRISQAFGVNFKLRHYLILNQLAVFLLVLLESPLVTWVIFKLLIGSSGRPSHESNNYSILHFLIADPQPRGRAAKALLSNPID